MNEREKQPGRNRRLFLDNDVESAPAMMSRSIEDGFEREYIAETMVSLEHTELYAAFMGVGLEIDDMYGRDARMGESYATGAIICIDMVGRHAEYLLHAIETDILTHVGTQRARYLSFSQSDRYMTKLQKQAYVDALTQPQGPSISELGRDYENLLRRLSGAQYGQRRQYRSFEDGFRFVLGRAEKANEQDMETFKAAHELGKFAITEAELNEELEELLGHR